MKVALVHDARLPVTGYGGTERVVWWLAKGLSELGVEVVLVCQPGSRCPFAEVRVPDTGRPLTSQFPDITLFQFFVTPSRPPERPYVVSIGGNGKPGETYLINTAFVSRDHARRHGAECFVYNGLDPDEYVYRKTKQGYLLFLAKASWRVKNVKGAIRIARRSERSLHIVGGRRLFFNHRRGIHWDGMLGGAAKAAVVAGASGLLFPVLWNEPFGLAVIEAMVSGTPVLATPFGSLPELVAPGAGALCRTEKEFLEQIPRLASFRPADCRAWVMENFHYRKMAQGYLTLYERVLAGEKLNRGAPQALSETSEAVFTLP